MAETPGIAPAIGVPEPARRSWMDRSSGAVPLLLSTWMIAGLFVDAWSHTKGKPESFFSPWHALFYAGFLATAAWTVWPLARSRRAGKTLSDDAGRDSLGVAGLAIFAVGGVSDMLWHSILGIEQGLEVLTSPPHLFLFAGLILVASAPFRRAWAATGTGSDAPAFGAFLPAVLSLALATSVIGLATTHLWGFSHEDFLAAGTLDRVSAALVVSGRGARLLRELIHQRGVSNILLTNLILLAPILLMLRRWRLPFGSVTVFLTVTTSLVAIVTGVPLSIMLPVSTLTGLFADRLVQAIQPFPHRVGYFRAFGTVVPLVLWGLYFAIVQYSWGLAWPPAIWGGALLWTGASGLLISVVAVPSGVPAPPSADRSRFGD